MERSDLRDACSSSLLGAPSRPRDVHTSKHTLLANEHADRLPVVAVASSLTTGDIAEVSEAAGANLMVAPNRSLHSGLVRRTHLVRDNALRI